jgi:exodeoxyribonuclease VII small subunit
LAEAKTDPATLTFEDALKELEGIVTKLEGGQVSLEDSITLYERGEKLKARCEALLKDAEMRIEKITLSADGAPKGTEPLDVDR